MKKSFRMLELIAFQLALYSAIGCGKLRARDQLNKGVQSYKNGKYEDAIDHFQRAVSFDSGLIVARLYLATAYAQQYIPGADTPDNNKMAEQAIEEYKHVIERNPGKEQKINSVKGIAYLYLQMKKFEDAKKYYAMAYMNLLYREKADLECDDPAARAADLKTADEWVDKTMAAKKAKAEKQPGAQGITMQPSQ